MAENQLLPDDPRLTAYALGELDPTEQADVERMLGKSPAAQDALREIREVAARLSNELRQEPAPELTGAQRDAILVGQAAPVHVPAPVPVHHPRSISRRAARWISRFAAMAAMVALVAVAAFLPAPGNRSRDQQVSDYSVNGEIRNHLSSDRFNVALKDLDGDM